MYKGGYDWSKPFRKSARIVGDVIGKYHPHGDQSDYDALAYQRTRAPLYAELKEQLDLLYHDMAADKGDKTGEWFKAVKKVKDDNPKP